MTWWQPDKEDRSIYWTLDTERVLLLHQVKITFAQLKAFRYKVKVSNDSNNWSLLSDQTNHSKEIKEQIIEKDDKMKLCFVRISFPYQDGFILPVLSEVEVKGIVSN